MAQHDYSIANQGFPAFRSDLNDALAAIVSNNSGATEPTTMFADQMWVDTAANPSVLKIRNADNDAWITIGTINQTGDTFTLTSAVSATTLNTSGQVVFNDAGADVDFRVEGDTDANLLFVDASTDRVGIGTNTPSVEFEVNGDVAIAGAGNKLILPRASDGAQIVEIFSAIDNDLTLSARGSGSGFIRFEPSSGSGEAARITSGGYFKQADNGTYNDATGSYCEFNNTTNNQTCNFYARNASQTITSVEAIATRSATSAYSFLLTASGAGTDVEHRLRGDGNAYADGTWNNNGADYAEFFESANGEALTLGATVVLDGNKVREATGQDPASAVIGVVRPKEPSKASMVIGNTAWNKWANKYLTDDFDRYIMEDHDVVEWEETITDEEGNTSTKQHSYESHAVPEGITVPEDATVKTHDDKGNKFQHYKLNPEWNPDSEYVNRENRAEWNIIGLLGQVKILKGQPVGDRWIKMRDISETVEEWFIR